MGRNLRILTLLLPLSLLLTLSGCFETDNPPQLEVSVIDQDSLPVPDAYVTLFTSQQEWRQLENPAQAWRRTGLEGQVLFIDLKETTYWIYCRKGDQDNSFDEITTQGDLKLNQRARVVVHLR